MLEHRVEGRRRGFLPGRLGVATHRAGRAGSRLRTLGARAQAARHRRPGRVGRGFATPLAGPLALTAGEAAPTGEAAKSAREARRAVTPRAGLPWLGRPGVGRLRHAGRPGHAGRLDRAGRSGRIGFLGGVGSLASRPYARDATRGLGARVSSSIDSFIGSRADRPARAAVPATVAVASVVATVAAVVTVVVGTAFAALTEAATAAITAVVTAPVGADFGRSVGTVAGRPARRAHAAGRVRFDRSGRLKTSHGSRLFDGEGPTGEENNAARAAGPPTG
ncbi:hypothetical protein [Kitasatospora sp. NPDC127116]|uniref:hypothetical protein n=1 Tax=Kitasatospora sp. NPDC127116 TaxID=3345367 RepID=UPI003625E381